MIVKLKEIDWKKIRPLPEVAKVLKAIPAVSLTQMRENIEDEIARGETGEIGEIEVWCDGDVYWVVDGWHRLQEYLARKIEITRVRELKFETREKAVGYAVRKELTGRRPSSAQLKLWRAELGELMKADKNTNERSEAIAVVEKITGANVRRQQRDQAYLQQMRNCCGAVEDAVRAQTINPTINDLRAISQLPSLKQVKVLNLVVTKDCGSIAAAIRKVKKPKTSGGATGASSGTSSSSTSSGKPKKKKKAGGSGGASALASPQISDPEKKERALKIQGAEKTYEELYRKTVHFYDQLNEDFPHYKLHKACIGGMKELFNNTRDWLKEAEKEK